MHIKNLYYFHLFSGIRNPRTGLRFRYDDELIVPIIDNTPFEQDLEESLDKAIVAYPETCAVLVKRHGFYVWGDTWQETKTMTECYDYLFELAVQMKQFKMDPLATSKDHDAGLGQDIQV